MTTYDLITALFEGVFACVAWANVYALRRDKKVDGVWWVGFLFAFAWGLWALVFYSHVGFPLSKYAVVARLLGNGTWLSLRWHYRKVYERSPDV